MNKYEKYGKPWRRRNPARWRRAAREEYFYQAVKILDMEEE